MLFLATVACLAQRPASTAVRCDIPDRLELAVDKAGTALRNAGPDALLRMLETGLDVELEGPSRQWRFDAPPRLGWFEVLLPAGATVRLRALDPGTARVTVAARCAATHASAAWLDAAQKVSQALVASSGAIRVAPEPAALAQLATSAPDALARAYAIHLNAQSLYSSGRPADAAPAFLAAERQWTAAGLLQHAQAARVGAAEDLNRAARYAEALAVVDAAPPGRQYYDVRLQGAGCLARRYLGQLEPAARCYAQVIDDLAPLGVAVELAAQTIDYGSLELELGRTAAALTLFERAGEVAEGDGAFEARGRAAFFRTDALTRLGRFPEALHALGDALEEFEHARAGRWRASTLLRLASLLLELGAPGEAAVAVDEATRDFDPVQSPARVAAAELVRARIALHEHDAPTAARWARSAAATYERLAMPSEHATAQHYVLLALVEAGEDAQAATLAAALRSDPVQHDAAARLGAVVAIRQGRLEDAHAALVSIDAPPPLSLAATQMVLAQARLAAAQGDRAHALAELRRHADTLAAAAARVASPALADGLLRRTRLVDALAIELILQTAPDEESDAAAAALLAWLPYVPPSPAPDTAQEWNAIDRSLAAELFPALRLPGPEPATRAQLLQQLAHPQQNGSGRQRPLTRLDPAHLRGQIAPGIELLIILEGERKAPVIALNHDGAKLLATPDRAQLTAAADRMGELVQNPRSSLAGVGEAAQSLAALLATTGEHFAPSMRLTVLDDGIARRIAWPALSTAPAAQAMPVTLLVPTGLRPPAEEVAAPQPLDVYTAAQLQSGGLGALRGARGTATLLRSTLPQLDLREHARVTRALLLDALGRHGARLHIAAHGASVPGRLGGSGVWLEPADASARPEYLSWLDALHRPLAAQLVVLDACELAPPGAEAGIAQAGFASALVRSGARDVVAAMWPVSDTASAAWVPGFHAAAVQPRADIARALADARLRLSRSRAFRHPFYWAGLVHLQPVFGADAATR